MTEKEHPESNVPDVDSEEWNEATEEQRETWLEALSEDSSEDEDKDEDSTDEEEIDEEDNDDTSDEEDAEEASDKSEPAKADTQDKKEEESSDYEKRYKDLQRAFTKDREEMKALREELDDLKNPKTKAEKERKASIIDKIREENEKAASIFEALKEEIREEMREELDQSLNPIKSKISSDESQANLDAWDKGLQEFRSSDLKDLEGDLLTLINERFDSEDALVKEAGKNRNLFNELKKELIASNLDKVVSIKTKAQDELSSDAERDSEISKSKPVGKSKTSSKSKADPMEDLKAWNKLSVEEQEKILKAKGLLT